MIGEISRIAVRARHPAVDPGPRRAENCDRALSLPSQQGAENQAVAEESIDEHFVELVSSISHANGVFRVTLGQQVDAGTARPVTRLLIPANQLQAVLRGIADGANEIREKLQSQTADKDAAKGDDAKAAAAAKKPPAKK